MANTENIQEFPDGSVVSLKSRSAWLCVCQAPPKNDDAPPGWTWTVMWVAPEAGSTRAAGDSPPHPQYFLLPTACLRTPDASPSGD